MLYERDWALSGCSGYVQYEICGDVVTIGFSNPSVGTNKVGVGVGGGAEVWRNICSNDYEPFVNFLECGGEEIEVVCECTNGDVNDALVHFKQR